ncbi:DMT family transporter [Puniceibacterium sediminis]|uniref:EamA-like transporter family protein n=1 Tax=Puniceibacterium sediminis TaxID=1608407 RepID=A0A238WMC5_9RHOB|nr:DMT family transporter [Puniceibacterium sediminis]SNR47627.1 EamA-like transporter family protein [Puniceibacterium sediminis]
MPIFLLTALTMLAFAANSVLNRMALVGGGIDAVTFGTVRLLAGAVMLAILALAFRGGLRLGGRGRLISVLSLLVYVYGFSSAYLVLDTGLGALILFGVVQITMFAGAVLGREKLSMQRTIGALTAFAGLVWLLWPGAGVSVSLLHGALMAAAGIGWGLYSLAGRGAGDPLASTAANFIIAAPIGLALTLLMSTGTTPVEAEARGLILAVLSGAGTSALGYLLWYGVLPKLDRTVAAVAQLTVPVIALIGGLVFLGEVPTLGFVLAAAVVLGGVALSVVPLRGR